MLMMSACYHLIIYLYLYEKERSSEISLIVLIQVPSMLSSERTEVGNLPLLSLCFITHAILSRDLAHLKERIYQILLLTSSQIEGCSSRFRMFLKSQGYDFSNTSVRFIVITLHFIILMPKLRPLLYFDVW